MCFTYWNKWIHDSSGGNSRWGPHWRYHFGSTKNRWGRPKNIRGVYILPRVRHWLDRLGCATSQSLIDPVYTHIPVGATCQYFDWILLRERNSRRNRGVREIRAEKRGVCVFLILVNFCHTSPKWGVEHLCVFCDTFPRFHAATCRDSNGSPRMRQINPVGCKMSRRESVENVEWDPREIRVRSAWDPREIRVKWENVAGRVRNLCGNTRDEIGDRWSVMGFGNYFHSVWYFVKLIFNIFCQMGDFPKPTTYYLPPTLT